MRLLEEYVNVGTRRLRCGYTTGTCAAAAARAATELLCGRSVEAVQIETPAGIPVVVEVEDSAVGDDWAQAAVRKDAGDDPDATDGILVVARVKLTDEPDIRIEGGEGVGRVTQPGLDQSVGAAAINSVPRRMIREQVEQTLGSAGSSGALVTISVPCGEEIAKKTFNPRLGIEDGISIIGTSGIVRPMSEEALVASIELELNMLAERGVRDLLVVPGNYGRDFAEGRLGVSLEDAVQCSNFFGATIDAAARLGFRRMLIVGHIGKMAKVAGGIMHTHSRMADCRVEVLAAHAALAGADRDVVARIMDAATTDAALDALSEAGLVNVTMQSLMASLADKLAHRAGDALHVEAIVFSNVHGILGQTPGAEELLEVFRKHQESQG